MTGREVQVRAVYEGKFVFRLCGTDVSCDVLPSASLRVGEVATRYRCSHCRLEVQVVAGQGTPWCCAQPMEVIRPRPDHP